MSFTSVDFPAPETPVTATSTPSGISTSTSRRLFSCAPWILRLPFATRRWLGDLDPAAAREVGAGQRVRASARGSRACPRGRCGRPATPAPRPKSITWSAARIVSSSCSTTTTVLPMSRMRKRVVEQAAVVARVEADRGLVEDVDDAREIRADLAREADALRLAARERRTRAVEGEVAEADGGEEVEARRGSPSAPRRRSRGRRRSARSCRRRRGRRRRSAPRSRRASCPATRTAALSARRRVPWQLVQARVRHVLRVPGLHALGLGVLEAAHELGDQAFPGRVELASAALLALPFHTEAALAGAVEDLAALLLGELSPGLVGGDAELGAGSACESPIPSPPSRRRSRPRA